MHYFTWKLELVSNILWMIIGVLKNFGRFPRKCSCWCHFSIKWTCCIVSLGFFVKKDSFLMTFFFRNFRKWMVLEDCFWTVQDSFFWSNLISYIAVFQLVFFYNVTRKTIPKPTIIKPRCGPRKVLHKTSRPSWLADEEKFEF